MLIEQVMAAGEPAEPIPAGMARAGDFLQMPLEPQPARLPLLPCPFGAGPHQLLVLLPVAMVLASGVPAAEPVPVPVIPFTIR